MHIHILGICGTFMGSLAVLAKELGHTVTGSDANVYPPMSTQLEAQGIRLMQGYDAAHLNPAPDLVIIGNAMSRGNTAVEYVLNTGIPYTSGPAWLASAVLQSRHVIAIAGTHGKTTTTTMVAWILEQAELSPGFLIGGVPLGFAASARLGGGDFFVVEADEYDSAFFDKRSKFIHYAPKTAILNNLEFDHADIFDDLDAIKKQFHHFVRTVPGNGRIIAPANDANIQDVLSKGCWTLVENFSVGSRHVKADWWAELIKPDGSEFKVYRGETYLGTVAWAMTGEHSVNNGLAAIIAAEQAGVKPAQACAALSCFPGVKRRMELLGTPNNIAVYDDFAHHPTAIATTLAGLRNKVGAAKIFAIIEPRSNTMRLGAHKENLPQSVRDASEVLWYQPAGLSWDLDTVIANSTVPAQLFSSLEAIQEYIKAQARPGDHIVVMSNGGFGGIHQKLITALS